MQDMIAHIMQPARRSYADPRGIVSVFRRSNNVDVSVRMPLGF